MKKQGKELQFISIIKRDGSGTIPVEGSHNKFLSEETFTLTPLSISHQTYIAHNFNAYVVKLNPVHEYQININD